MSSDKELQTVNAADVGTIDAAGLVAAFKPKVDGTGSFYPPGVTPPAPPPVSPEAAERGRLLLEHKMLGATIINASARRAVIETQMVKIDAKQSLAMKLAALSPAERELLEDTLAEKAQRRINETATDPPAPAGA